MIPYIKNIDVTKPFGKLVYNYGEQRYISGLTFGFILGVSTTVILFCIKTQLIKIDK
jgi:hypothetical protein